MEFIEDVELQVSRLEVVEGNRRRRFSDEAKLAMVAESYCGHNQIGATARRHGITRWQLSSWRKAAREGKLRASPDGFVAAVVVPDLLTSGGLPIPAAPSTSASVPAGRMEIVAGNARRVIVDRDVDTEALLRIMRALETLR